MSSPATGVESVQEQRLVHVLAEGVDAARCKGIASASTALR